MDGAIGSAGGRNLYEDRLSLPVIAAEEPPHVDEGDMSDNGGGAYYVRLRCPTGDAKITGPGDYGRLRVPYVIHAVGPAYFHYDCLEDGDKLLRSAYVASLERAKEAKLEAVAFCLLSAGVFRGRQSMKEVLRIGMEAICGFEGYDELREVHICAYTGTEIKKLIEIAEEMDLQPYGLDLCQD